MTTSIEPKKHAPLPRARVLVALARGALGSCVLLALAATFVRAEERTVKSLRDVLTPDEFRRAGLEKLTPAELEFLSQRLLAPEAKPDVPEQAASLKSEPANPPATAAPPAPAALSPAPQPRAEIATDTPAAAQGEDAFGREERLRASVEKTHRIPKVLESRIVGSFTGWNGRTLFQLENGQVWQQVEDGQFSVHLEAPKVRIEKGAFGTYYLGVEGYGTRVKVRRVH